MPASEHDAVLQEFDRQLGRLLDAGYPELAGIASLDFAALVEPLRQGLAAVREPCIEGRLAFVIVVEGLLVRAEDAMAAVVDGRGRPGVVDMTPVAPSDFAPRPGTDLPTGPAYLLADVDLGADTLGVRPEDALAEIEEAKRLPLTIDEGVAVLTQFPEVLDTHNAYQLLASRRGDQRVPSIWRSYGRPRLGWCWDRAPHSWMGSASAAARLGSWLSV